MGAKDGFGIPGGYDDRLSEFQKAEAGIRAGKRLGQWGAAPKELQKAA